MKRRRKSITEIARELRKNLTKSERLLWKHLRKRRLNGHRFVRQKPFIYKQRQTKKYFYIGDFYCPQKKLLVELDGKIHGYQQNYDYQRDLVLDGLGITTLWVKDEELEHIALVKRKILAALE